MEADVNSEQFIFVYGVSVRSGTNFMARLLSKYDEIEVIPRNETSREFPLLKEISKFESAFTSFAKRHNRNMGKKGDFNWDSFKPYFGNAFTNYIKDHHIHSQDKKYYLIKEPKFDNIEQFFDLFPSSKLILILRDGRDLIASTEKAHTLKRANQNQLEQLKRKAAIFSGRVFKATVHHWKDNILKGLDFYQKNKDNYPIHLIKYEDVVSNDLETMHSLFEFIGIEFRPELMDKVEVIGSSFSDQIGAEKQKISWKPIEKTKAFQPIGRWKQWPQWKINYFNKHAKQAMEKAGYSIEGQS